MGMFALIMFIFFIAILAIISALWLKTKQFYAQDIIRFIGAIIGLISSGIILVFQDKFEPAYNNLTVTINQYTGTSLNVMILCLLGFFLLLAIFKASRV